MTLTYEAALDYIHSFDDPYRRAIREHGKQTWGLEGIRQVLEKLGNPHLAYPTIHIAGTKGKGSTAAFIAHGLIESGLKTGLYTSPPLQDWRERIQIDAGLIPREAVAALVEEFRPIVDDLPLSEFEVTTALAFWHFAREGCDAAVIEVGLGGRLDATNIVQPSVVVITSISLDHTQLLGDTIAEIAGEKAAIIKKGVPVVSTSQDPAAKRVISERADEEGSKLTLLGRDWFVEPRQMTWDGSLIMVGDKRHKIAVEIRLPGVVQVENAAVALAALNEAAYAGLPVTRQGRLDGLAKAWWPGRLEVVRRDPMVVLDSAHNPYSVDRLIESLDTLDDTPGTLHPVFVFGCMADKDLNKMLASLLYSARRVVLTRADHDRAAEIDTLSGEASAILTNARKNGEQWPDKVEVQIAPTVGEAVSLALENIGADDLVCITGSLSVAGEARDWFGIPAAQPADVAGE